MDYDAIAKVWDDDRRAARAKVIADRMRKHLAKAERAMEFGCGTGLIGMALRDLFGEIVLVDTSQGMIDVLREKMDRQAIGNMTAHRIDILSPPEGGDVLDGGFDAILTSMALHHVRDIAGVAVRFLDLLRDGGTLCIVDLDQDDGTFHMEEEGFDGHNGFDQGELGLLLDKAGFKGVRSDTFFRDTKAVMGKDTDYSLFIMTARKSL